jgi:RimK family alpha-L-glutamate ligase
MTNDEARMTQGLRHSSCNSSFVLRDSLDLRHSTLGIAIDTEYARDAMHLAILANSDSWYLQDLRRAAEGRHEIAAAGFRDLASSIDGNGLQVKAGKVDLAAADVVLVRTMPAGSLEQVVFRMDALARLEAAGVLIINPPKAIETAVDKYLALARMAAAGLRVPRTFVCQTPEDAMAAFDSLGGDIVVKPIFGSEGRGIARLQDESLAGRAFRMLAQLGGVLYVQEFVPHDGFDIRVLIIGERMFAIRRRSTHDWRTNVSRGAIAEPIELTAELAEFARRAADAVGALVAGIDLLPGCDGQLYAIEVNAVPGWKAVAAALDVDVARVLLEFVERTVKPT